MRNNLKILIFTNNSTDYLQDCVIHSLRNLLGDRAVDFPSKNWLYKNNLIDISIQKRKPFTFFRLLDENESVNRQNIKQRIQNNEFDYIIFSSVHRQYDILKGYYPILKKQKLVFLDGEDHPSLFGYNGKYWRNPKLWFVPKVHKKHLYFKREYTEETLQYRYFKLFPKSWFKNKTLKNVFPISFGFPDEKIIKELPIKEKLFPEHIVDNEIATKLNKKTKYVFDNEQDYFVDLQKSKFGITTKRASWDAMRHYEIAANAAVPCFRDLDKKPKYCAPHGLNKDNCIRYNNYDDLMGKINKLSDADYTKLQQNAVLWVNKNSTFNKAKSFIEDVENFYKKSFNSK